MTPKAAAARIALVVLGVAPAPATRAETASVVLAPDHTRIVIESETPMTFSLLVLRNPDRLVLDFEGAGADAAARALAAQFDARHPYLQPPRITRSSVMGVRVEVDLRKEVEPRIFSSKAPTGSGNRITLDLFPLAPARIVKAPEAPAIAARPDGVEVLLEVRINRQPVEGNVIALRRGDGRLSVRNEDLRRWRFRMSSPPSIPPGRDGHRALDALPGLTYRIDEPTQILWIEAPPELFAATALPGKGNVFAVPPPAPAGGFANYDVFANHVGGKTHTSAQLEVAAFNAWGVGVGSFLGRSAGPGAHWVRLETTFTHDMPASVSSLRIGDAINAPGTWGRSVRFGGVQLATNFNTQPSFITFPLPGFAGEAVLPSTIDLYVNDALRLRREVPTGPFSIQDLPIVTGAGDMRLVVRDLLGRERVIVQPFHATARLLQRGLHEYSYELGFVREDFALASNQYGRPLAVATHRIGFTDRFTGEAHAEILRGQRTGGVAGAFLWPQIGLFSASAAASNGPGGSGGLTAFGFERASRSWSVGASTQVASPRFVQLGFPPRELAPRQVSRAFASFSMKDYGAIGVGYVRQDNRSRAGVELVSATYSLSLGRAGFVSFSALRFLGDDAKTVVGLNYTYPLDALTTASASATGEPGSRQAQVQLQRNLPPGTGYGYRVLGAGGARDRFEAGASAQNDFGTYILEAARADGANGYRANASGGMAFVGGSAFLSRRIDESFAVVEVPGYAGVRVYSANQLVARTGAAGTALIPRLLPYQNNQVRIEQADLPMDAQVDAVQVDAVPFYRSGMRLPFPVKRSRGALLTLVLDSGQPLPAGALVRVAGDAQEFPVGLRGEAYVAGLGASNLLTATWRGQNCEIEVEFPPTEDPLPNLGIHACRGVAR